MAIERNSGLRRLTFAAHWAVVVAAVELASVEAAAGGTIEGAAWMITVRMVHAALHLGRISSAETHRLR
jgi:hypothetical protein